MERLHTIGCAWEDKDNRRVVTPMRESLYSASADVEVIKEGEVIVCGKKIYTLTSYKAG